ncbi:MAG: tRNA lysidine(34) synthetase TilS [Armatimonadota bacterium]
MSSAPDILKAVYLYSLFSSKDKVVVAVSGGPDSVAMLHALHHYALEYDLEIFVAHINHGLRGKESDEDENFVADLAHKLALPITVKRADVSKLRRQERLSEEEAARKVRYRLLRETAVELGCNKIAVGHTADDRVETVLLNILRGSGIRGLGCMQARSDKIVRPLIETWRTEILVYLNQNNLTYRVDSSNLDTKYTRNRVRLELIPLLESNFGTQVKTTLLRLAKLAEAHMQMVDQLVYEASLMTEWGTVHDSRLVASLVPALTAELVRNEIKQAIGSTKDIAAQHLETAAKAIAQSCDFTLQLPGGSAVIEKKGIDLHIGQRDTQTDIEPFEIRLIVPGYTYVPPINTSIDAELIDHVHSLHVRPNVALLDTDKIKGELRVRNIRPGDRIVPLGIHNHKKLHDVFIDKKIPISKRKRAAVVEDDEKILWVVGIVSSEEAKVTTETRQVIRLVATPD